MRFLTLTPIALLLAAVAGAACSSSGDLSIPNGDNPGGGDIGDGGDGTGVQGYPFEPVAASVYVPKVKNLMTGLPATADEIAKVTNDPTQMKSLVDSWMALPQFQGKMVDFFRNAFQQNQVNLNTLMQTINVNISMNGTY
ncbi:MAG TPA: hypothetical protein VF407_14800, partial [Polyangiaceae bacterium]